MNRPRITAESPEVRDLLCYSESAPRITIKTLPDTNGRENVPGALLCRMNGHALVMFASGASWVRSDAVREV